MIRILIISIFLLFSNCIHSQDLTLYTMSPGAYNTTLRPSIMPDKKYFLAIPFFSSFHLELNNNSFAYHDFYQTDSDDSIRIDMDEVLDNLNENNFIGGNLSALAFEFGTYIKKSYVDFSINERVNFGLNLPDKFLELIIKGNGQFVGQELDLSDLALDMTHFREYSLGVSRSINEKLSLGIRAKYLYGMENISTLNEKIIFKTMPDDYSLQLTSDVRINTSGYFNAPDGYDEMKTNNYILGLNNNGFAIDLGGTYKLNEKIELNASVLDLGFISWNDYVKNFTIDKGMYEFNGIDLQDFINDSTDNLESVIDSITDFYEPEETTESYTSNLHSRVFTSGTYQLRESTTASALIYLQFFNGIVMPSYSISAGQKLGKVFTVNLSYSYLNKGFDNLGLGLLLQTKSLNIFFATNNIFGMILPLSYQTFGFKGGISFNWGTLSK